MFRTADFVAVLQNAGELVITTREVPDDIDDAFFALASSVCRRCQVEDLNPPSCIGFSRSHGCPGVCQGIT